MDSQISGSQMLFGALVMLFICVASGAGAYFRALSKINDLAERVARTETFINMLGMEAFTKLHRDDDAYGLDYYVNRYVANNYDLPMEDWVKVQAICTNRLDANTGGSDTAFFIMVKALATHKLMAYQANANRK